MRKRNSAEILTVIIRKEIVERLKYGICPYCGCDTERRYAYKEQTILTYCTGVSCKFYDEAYRNIHKWLVHHGL